jgi:hypothetical protein
VLSHKEITRLKQLWLEFALPSKLTLIVIAIIITIIDTAQRN